MIKWVEISVFLLALVSIDTQEINTFFNQGQALPAFAMGTESFNRRVENFQNLSNAQNRIDFITF